MAISGGCRCGAVRYTLAADAMPQIYVCHCHDCQTWSGSAFTQQAMIPEDMLTVTGPLVIYEYEAPSVRLSRQRMCGVCHTRIFNTNAVMPGVAVLRAGTLDDSHLLEPAAHIWTKRKQPWVVIPEGVPGWEESPAPEEYAKAMRERKL